MRSKLLRILCLALVLAALIPYAAACKKDPEQPENPEPSPTPEGEPVVQDNYLFKLNEIEASEIKLLDYSSEALIAANPSKNLPSITTVKDGIEVLEWTPVDSSRGMSFNLPAEVNLMSATVIRFSIYSEESTNAKVQIRLNCPDELKGNNAMAPYFRYVITVDFKGWKTFELNSGVFSSNYAPTWSRISSVNFDCSGWSLIPAANTRLLITCPTAVEKNYEIICPVGVTDPSLAEYYTPITAKYRELLVGTPNGSTAPEYTSRVTSVANSCKKIWITNSNSFKNTFKGVDKPDTLFGYDMSGRNPNNNVDETKISSVYENLLAMAKAYGTKGDTNPYYHNAELLADIKLGLEYGYNNYYGPTVWIDGVYGNWWHWDIGVPLKLTGILVILESELGYDLCKKYLEPFDYLNPLPNMTACNKVWITRCILLSAALQHDAKRILMSNVEVSDVFDYVTQGDGFYEDGSFVQHDNLAYTGGYGLSMLEEVTNIMYFMGGSRFEPTDPDVANQYNWVFDNFRPCIYDSSFMAAMRGREICRSTASESGAQNTAVIAMIKMQSYAPAEIKAELESLIRHYMISSNKNYASGVPLCLVDYVLALRNNDAVVPATGYEVVKVMASMDRIVQHRPTYGACLALSSTRIAKYESINRENQTAWYIGDGMVYIYTDGYDYNTAFYNYADPYKMPGTTVNSAERNAVCPSPQPLNGSAFAGGVTSGAFGVAGYLHCYDAAQCGTGAKTSSFKSNNDTKIKAYKSYFFFDNEIVCLGSGITDVSGTAVRTVVENRAIRNGDVFMVNNATVNPTTTITSANADYMHFTNMGGYVFLNNSGDKNDITYRKYVNGSYSFLEITLEHGIGTSALNGTYAYVYLPEATSEQTASYSASPDITILYRNNSAHAVTENKLGILGCVFFDNKATVTDPNGVTSVRKISTKDSCTVMVKKGDNGETYVYVSDPTQNLSSIRLELETSATQLVSADAGVSVTFGSGKTTVQINSLGAKGATFAFVLK